MIDTRSLEELKGRRVLVTGSSSGIGAAAAMALGACGAHVAIHFNTNRAGAETIAAAIQNSGGVAHILQGNLALRGSGPGLVADAAKLLGGLDLLINNAGDMLERRPLEQITEADLDAIVDLNIRPVVSASAAAIPLLRASGYGAIINVSSVAARAGGSLGGNLYAASKAFVGTYTRGLARELAPDGVRVNAVSPGIIDTALHMRRTSPEQYAGFAAAIPMGRVGSPDDCAGAFLFLACRSLSGYMTGQTIEVNGGQLMV